MKRAALAAALLVALGAQAQTRIASGIEIRQMEEAAAYGEDSGSRVAAYISLGDLRLERNELALGQRAYDAALKLATEERADAWKVRDLKRYALACSWIGVAHGRLGHGVEAFAILEEAARYAGDSRGTWNTYSVAMYRLGELEKAIGTARIAVALSERATRGRAPERALLELTFDQFSLAQALLERDRDGDSEEAEKILLAIAVLLESDRLRGLRKRVAEREEFEVISAPTTDSGMYLAIFNRAHMRLAWLYEKRGALEKAASEYKTVLSRRTDEPMALGGLARLAVTAEERDRYLILSLDANPFADDIVADYVDHVASGKASPATPAGSVGSVVRTAIQQIHARDVRHARETLRPLLAAHPNNDVLRSLLARAEIESGDLDAARAVAATIRSAPLRARIENMIRQRSPRPLFLDQPAERVADPSEHELRAVVRLFAGNKLTAEDRAVLDRTELSSVATFAAGEGEMFERGTIARVPFRFQTGVSFRGIPAGTRTLRIVYRILGATTLDGEDALLLEPLRAEVVQ
jgi:tetratricopeptide (TPR) repeat protein